MSDADRVFAGSIPDVYDQYLVPLIFEAYQRVQNSVIDLNQKAASGSKRSSNQSSRVAAEVGVAAIRTRNRAAPSLQGRNYQLRSFGKTLSMTGCRLRCRSPLSA